MIHPVFREKPSKFVHYKGVEEFRGLSTDDKPMNAANGSEFIEMDTGKKFLFSAADATWHEQPSSGGGGSVEPLIVRLTAESEDDVMDKTYQEIYDSIANGVPAYLLMTNVANSVALFPIIECVPGHGYAVHVDVGSENHIYSTTTSDGFPARVGK